MKDGRLPEPEEGVVERFHRLTSRAEDTTTALARAVTLVEQIEGLGVHRPSVELEYQFGGEDPDTGEAVDGYLVSVWGSE